MSGFPWWTWIIAAGALALTEMVLPSSYLMWIALGAAGTAVADAVLGLSLEGQLGVFAVATSLSCLFGYFVYDWMHSGGDGGRPLNQPRRAMVGARGIVCEQFQNGRGKVRVGDTVWLAIGPDLAADAPVIVSGLDGTRLIVEELQPRSSSDRREAAPAP